MKTTIHLKDATGRLIEGHDITANCEQVVKRAVFSLLWDTLILGVPTVRSGMFCKDCILKSNIFWLPPEETGESHYLYALLPGEVVKQDEIFTD